MTSLVERNERCTIGYLTAPFDGPEQNVEQSKRAGRRRTVGLLDRSCPPPERIAGYLYIGRETFQLSRHTGSRVPQFVTLCSGW